MSKRLLTECLKLVKYMKTHDTLTVGNDTFTIGPDNWVYCNGALFYDASRDIHKLVNFYANGFTCLHNYNVRADSTKTMDSDYIPILLASLVKINNNNLIPLGI